MQLDKNYIFIGFKQGFKYRPIPIRIANITPDFEEPNLIQIPLYWHDIAKTYNAIDMTYSMLLIPLPLIIG